MPPPAPGAFAGGQCGVEARADHVDDFGATVPRCGYRFAAPVERVVAPSPSPLVGEGRVGGSRDYGPTVPHSPTPTPNPSPQGGEEQSKEEDRPSVAVLPFTNLSGDRQQDYFSDGMTEDITTELSRFSELVVIARNSAFQYKGKAVDIRQVGRELGARYVLEGSVRRSGDHVRIAAQLIDAMTGAHRWAERYDRKVHDAFAVQDEMACTIVATLAAHVNRAEAERALLKPPAAWEAYEYYLRGAEAYFLHLTRRTKASLYDARRLLEQSLAIDPDYARAAVMLARTHGYAYFEPLDGDYLNPAALDRALELAESGCAPRPPRATGSRPAWIRLAFQTPARRRHRRVRARLRAQSQFHRLSIRQRRDVCGRARKSDRGIGGRHPLDPFQPSYAFGTMGIVNYMLKRYGEAVRRLRHCTLGMPNVQWPHAWLAAGYARLGQLEEAGAEAADVLRINPAFTIESWKRTAPFKDPKDLEHLIDGLRKAGLPET